MREIRLTQGQVALVDDEDVDELNQHKWCAHYRPDIKSYYAVRSGRAEGGKARTIHMAREILNCLEGMQVDHINHDSLDNRKLNLNLVSPRQNQQNQKTRKTQTSIYPGVGRHKARQKWRSQIRIGTKNVYLGLFETELAAFEAYCAALTHIGEAIYLPERFEQKPRIKGVR